ncbi:MAG: rhodanese-like domain-containing protein [Pseudomonadales bacterium]
MSSPVTRIPAAAPADALAHFQRRLGFETDCWDVHEALTEGPGDFVLLDVRSPDLYAAGHVPGAVNLPHGKMTKRVMARWPADTVFVVYCAGPHCNGANKAAVRLATLGLAVKEMIGGMTGWADEGFEFARGDQPAAGTALR